MAGDTSQLKTVSEERGKRFAEHFDRPIEGIDVVNVQNPVILSAKINEIIKHLNGKQNNKI